MGLVKTISAHLGKPLRILQKNVWVQFHEFGECHHLCVAAVSGDATVLPSRKLTYPTIGKENNLQKCLGRGYVSSLERKLEKLLAGSTCWLALRWCSRRLNTRFSTQVVLMRSHVSPSLLFYPSFFQKVKMEDLFHQEIHFNASNDAFWNKHLHLFRKLCQRRTSPWVPMPTAPTSLRWVIMASQPTT